MKEVVVVAVEVLKVLQTKRYVLMKDHSASNDQADPWKENSSEDEDATLQVSLQKTMSSPSYAERYLMVF